MKSFTLKLESYFMLRCKEKKVPKLHNLLMTISSQYIDIICY